MFKIPNWEEDVPKSNITFDKTSKKKKKTISSPQQIKVLHSQNDTKNNNKMKPGRAISTKKNNDIKKKKKELERKIKSNVRETLNSHIPGQFVINPNKRKLDESNKQEAKSEKKNKKKRKKISNGKNNESVKEINISKSNKNINNEIIEQKAPQNINVNSKKEKLKKMLQLQSNRNKIDGSINSSNLRQRMLDKLKAAQFRYINEKLYTSSGSDAKQLFQNDPAAFQTYHQGYQQQVKKWPVNPIDFIVKRIVKKPKSHIIADMGCGEAALSKRVPHKVRSFDLVSLAPGVEVCDMAHTPLLAESVDTAVYCLALMGTDLTQYLVEANRVLKTGGHLLIAEVESRFEQVETFIEGVQKLGFKLINQDRSQQVFFFFEFAKVQNPPVKKAKLPSITLKPCIYKRR